jgi:hypothetical protein
MGKKTVNSTKRRLDRVFSKFIRLRDSLEVGMAGRALCFTCGKMYNISELDAGHFINRKHNSTRYNEQNVFAQCTSCNRYQHGAKDVYALALVNRFGQEILEDLNVLKHTHKSFTIPELEAMIDYYKEKVEELERS